MYSDIYNMTKIKIKDQLNLLGIIASMNERVCVELEGKRRLRLISSLGLVIRNVSPRVNGFWHLADVAVAANSYYFLCHIDRIPV